MNEQPITTGIEQIKPPLKITPREKVRELWTKFYSNKKVFWPITGAVSFFLLVLIAGLLFGTRKSTIKPVIPTSTPAALTTPTPTESGDILTTINVKLIQLDAKIKELDIRQSRLSPPVVNFDIKF